MQAQKEKADPGVAQLICMRGNPRPQSLWDSMHLGHPVLPVSRPLRGTATTARLGHGPLAARSSRGMNSSEPFTERAHPNPAGLPWTPPTGGGRKSPLELSEIQIFPVSHGPTTATSNGTQVQGAWLPSLVLPALNMKDAWSAGRRLAPRAPPPGMCLVPISPEIPCCCPVPSPGPARDYQSPPLSSVLKQNF